MDFKIFDSIKNGYNITVGGEGWDSDEARKSAKKFWKDLNENPEKKADYLKKRGESLKRRNIKYSDDRKKEIGKDRKEYFNDMNEYDRKEFGNKISNGHMKKWKDNQEPINEVNKIGHSGKTIASNQYIYSIFKDNILIENNYSMTNICRKYKLNFNRVRGMIRNHIYYEFDGIKITREKYR